MRRPDPYAYQLGYVEADISIIADNLEDELNSGSVNSLKQAVREAIQQLRSSVDSAETAYERELKML